MLKSLALLVSPLAACAVLVSAARADVRPGAPAPDFMAVDSNGKQVTLSSFKGKTVVLEWTNHLCPYTAKHYDAQNMQAHQKDAAAKGVVWLTIVSSAPGTQGHVSAKRANELTASRKASPAAVLLDPEGKVGRLYAAKTTPHMFVINAAGNIVYMGAIDDQPSASIADLKKAKSYVRPAIEAAINGTSVARASTRPYGCSVKYADPRS